MNIASLVSVVSFKIWFCCKPVLANVDVATIAVWQWTITHDGMFYISGPLKKILTWLSSYFGRYFHLHTLSHFIQLKLLNLSWLAWKWMMKRWQKLHYKFSKTQEVKLRKIFLTYDRKFYILLCLSGVLYGFLEVLFLPFAYYSIILHSFGRKYNFR